MREAVKEVEQSISLIKAPADLIPVMFLISGSRVFEKEKEEEKKFSLSLSFSFSFFCFLLLTNASSENGKDLN
jgi:hypothetical protein